MKTKLRTAIESAIAEQKRNLSELQKEQQAFLKMLNAESNVTTKEKEKRLARATGIDLSKYKPSEEKAKHEAWAQKLEKEYIKAHHRHPKPPPAILTNYPFPQPPADTDQPIRQDACFFPAMECTGDKCEVDQATLHPMMTSGYLGGDFGAFAYAEPAPAVHTLSYGFTSPVGGRVNVLAQIEINGFIEAHSDLGNSILNAIYQHANANAKLILRLKAIQFGITKQNFDHTIISLHANPGNAKKREFHNEFFLLSLNNVDVTAGEPLVIQFIVETYAEGQSGFAHATVNFAKPAGGIKARQVCYFFEEIKYGRS